MDMSPRRLLSLCVFVVAAAGAGPARADSAKPWRLRDAAGMPAWLDFGVSYRVRVEHLVNQFRAGAPQTDATALVMRTLAAAKATFDPVFFGAELEDSRAFATDDTPLKTSSVDALELLQAYAGISHKGLFASGDRLELQLGRMTMDVGSRRLVARNHYRNTLNAFTGLDVSWTSKSKRVLRAFGVMPVTRRPSDAGALRDNDIQIDKENTDAILSGVFFAAPKLAAGATLELYALGLFERDGDVASRNRRLVTAGVRAVRKKNLGKLDFELEAMGQFGTSRASRAADDTTDLDHRAFFVHAQVGRTLRAPWRPRLIAQYDYASGDSDPNDGENNRFDTLFGARRWEFGPTGIYGPFARANLNTPGVRVQVKPTRRVSAFFAYRLYWLASATDAWTTSGLRDPTGGSGKFLGHQVEARFRFNVLPKNLRFEVGAAHLIRGRFATDVTGARDDPATLVYAQVVGWI